jgi:hypothetical protein
MNWAADARRWTQMKSLFLICVSLCLSGASSGEIIDRIAVTAGKHVITESDVIRDMRIAAFLDQKPVDLSGESKRKAASRLLDQYLILEEATFSHLALPATADGEDLVDQVKSQYASEAGYRAALAKYGIGEQEVVAQLVAGLRTSRFTDLRFRPEIQLSDDELHEFYDTLVEKWKQEKREGIPSFEESRSTVERLLTEQRTMQALDRWLGATRTTLRIVYREELFK